jgi:hypothetical protein
LFEVFWVVIRHACVVDEDAYVFVGDGSTKAGDGCLIEGREISCACGDLDVVFSLELSCEVI